MDLQQKRSTNNHDLKVGWSKCSTISSKQSSGSIMFCQEKKKKRKKEKEKRRNTRMKFNDKGFIYFLRYK